jgi:cellulose synthase/poly-beta-1,6-N-acetylglucosamine synthase-like glycosyltransferase
MNTFFSILIWLSYFIGLYTAIFLIVQYVDNRYEIKNERNKKIKLKRFPAVSVIVPVHNEEKTVIKTLDSVKNLNYPADKLQIVVVNDCSNDNTRVLVEEFIIKNPQLNLVLLNNKINKGKAYSLNRGLKIINGEYFACLDADSMVEKDALLNILYTHETHDAAIVTPIMKIAKPTTLLQKFQRLEYMSSMLMTNVLGYMNCNFVAPGPFSVYKTSVIKKLGGFDETSIVEDQEIAYRVQANHYKIKQSPNAYVHTVGPDHFEKFKKQRNRWSKGTLLNLIKYKKLFFNKKYGDFGFFQLPIIFLSFLLSIIVVLSFFYYLVRPIYNQIYNLYLVNFDIMPYLHTFKYNFDPLNINASSTFIIYVMLMLGLYLLFVASRETGETVRKHGSIMLVPYFLIYYLIISFINVYVILELLRKKKVQKW